MVFYMSSFIIDVEEYVKAGAFLGAFTEIKNYYREPVIYKYNFEKGCLSNYNDVVKDFIELYKLNVKSFNDQYNESNRLNVKVEDYTNLISQYVARAKQIAHNKELLSQTIFNLHKFFRSVNYQIEEDNCSRKANKIMGEYRNYMFEILNLVEQKESECWGEFEIAE